MAATEFQICGVRGSGKTRLCLDCAPEAILSLPYSQHEFVNGGDIHGLRLHKMRHGDTFGYEGDNHGGVLVLDFSRGNDTRNLLGIGKDVRILMVHMDSVSAVCRKIYSDHLYLRNNIRHRLGDYYDVILYDSFYEGVEAERGRVTTIGLWASQHVFIQRSNNPQVWGGRGPYNRDEFVSTCRNIANGSYGDKVLCWDDQNQEWIPKDKYRTMVVDRLVPWYHDVKIFGMGIPVAGNGRSEFRWQAIKRVLLGSGRWGDTLPPSVRDIGSNAGYNSIEMAKLGARVVVAHECDQHYLEQFRLVQEAGKFSNVDLVQLDTRPIQRVEYFGYKDFALMSLVHYHINRSPVPPYREPRTSFGGLNPPLAVVIEDLMTTTGTLILVTNLQHLERPAGDPAPPYPEVAVDWIVGCLKAVGWQDIRIHDGDTYWTPIVTARGTGGRN